VAATNIQFGVAMPGAAFRNPPVPCASPGRNGTAVVAWCDSREGPNRIYTARKTALTGWTTAPLFPVGSVPADQHDFMPQIDAVPPGGIGCAFYRFGPKPTGTTNVPTIDVITAVSTDDGATFDNAVLTTLKPWDPSLDAPNADAKPLEKFIGDYFGFAASPLGWFPFWTDTNTGDQEIFTARVHWVHQLPFYGEIVNTLIGSFAGGPLWRLTPRGFVPFNPPDPEGPIKELSHRTREAMRQIAHGLATLKALDAQLTRLGQ
jgi:hypothetical protein